MATKAETPSSSGTPAATAAPNASSRISSVPPIENCIDFASSAASAAPSAFCADASPYSSTRSCGWASWTAATAASGASADFASFVSSAAVSNLPGSVKFTTTERPSLETVSARCAAFSGLSMSVTPSIFPSRLTTSFTAEVTAGSSDLIEPLPWMSTRSPIVSGKPASSTIIEPRLDSPLPLADCSRFCWPTLPPMRVARTTKRIQPMTGGLAVGGTPSAGACREVARLHGAPGEGFEGDRCSLPAGPGPSQEGLQASVFRKTAVGGAATSRRGVRAPSVVRRRRAPCRRSRPRGRRARPGRAGGPRAPRATRAWP